TNHYGVVSDVVSVNVSVDVTLPSVVVNSPRPGEWVGGRCLLNVTAVDDNGVRAVEWRVYVVANETTGRLEVPYGYSDTWSTTLLSGTPQP
ncbi:MAG: hypothetical protein ACTSP1_12840, partial [Candidatus Freyarchaeota archaeon]